MNVIYYQCGLIRSKIDVVKDLFKLDCYFDTFLWQFHLQFYDAHFLSFIFYFQTTKTSLE